MPDLESTALMNGTVLSVVDVRCRPTAAESGTEVSAADVIIFPRSGAFTVRTTDASQTVFDANKVCFLNRGDEYRVRHTAPSPDRCTNLHLTAAVLDELLFYTARSPRCDGRFPSASALLDPHLDFVHRQLVRLLETTGSSARLAAEEVALALAHAALRLAAARQADTSRISGPQHRFVIEAQEVMNARFTDPLTLGELATAVGVTPFHLSRTFHRVTGVRLWTYLMRLRIREAVSRLTDGAPDISRVAHDLGFSDHSHLTTSIRRELGEVPTTVRQGRGLDHLLSVAQRGVGVRLLG